jgi:hypothetical protein
LIKNNYNANFWRIGSYICFLYNFHMKNLSLIKSILLALPIIIVSILSVAINQSIVGEEEFEITPVLLAPMAISDENVYVIWSSNNTGDWEVLIRISNDNGMSFSEKMNLSNSTGSDSINAEIEASGNNVFVTWWENNQTSNDPVMRISQDSGNTFGPVLNLAANDTLRAAQ